LGCVSTYNQTYENETNSIIYPDLSDKDYCRGSGYITSGVGIKGRLNFTFTSSRSKAYIEFKDLIGRKTLFLILDESEVKVWDILNNRRYNQSSILLALPFFEIINSKELITFLWGEIPSKFSDPSKIKSEKENISGTIQFNTKQTTYGQMVETLSFKVIEDNSKINLFMMNREFNVQYPHLIREIPSSVLLIKDNS
jgi:hypothetical protein|tara:strand:+ start:5503 stop:6093 length:591 start_codon:yes stop_codon:yes gene_type:complete